MTNVLPIFTALHSDQSFLNLYYENLEEKGREKTGKDAAFISAKSDLLIGNTSEEFCSVFYNLDIIDH